jgi:hypothetical protein
MMLLLLIVEDIVNIYKNLLAQQDKIPDKTMND